MGLSQRWPRASLVQPSSLLKHVSCLDGVTSVPSKILRGGQSSIEDFLSHSTQRLISAMDNRSERELQEIRSTEDHRTPRLKEVAVPEGYIGVLRYDGELFTVRN